jgi:hypothetical protein
MDHHSTENMPPWVRRVDDQGVRRWHREKSQTARRGEYIGNIIVNLIFLWIVNKIPEWNPGFIANNYGAVLWILNVNILIQIGGNLLMAVFDYPGIRYLARIVTEAASFLTMMVLYFLYPFNFSNYPGLHWLDWFLPIAFIIGMVISALKVFSNIWKLLFWRS